MSNPLFWILERLYAPMEYYGVKGIKLTKKGKTVAKYEFVDSSNYVSAGTPPEPVKNGGIGAVEEYDDSAYFHEQLDEILAELRKLVKNTTPKNPHPRDVGPTVLRENDPVLDAKTVRKLAKSYIYGEYNPRVSAKILGDWPGEPEIDPAAFTNIVRGSN